MDSAMGNRLPKGKWVWSPPRRWFSHLSEGICLVFLSEGPRDGARWARASLSSCPACLSIRHSPVLGTVHGTWGGTGEICLKSEGIFLEALCGSSTSVSSLCYNSESRGVIVPLGGRCSAESSCIVNGRGRVGQGAVGLTGVQAGGTV